MTMTNEFSPVFPLTWKTKKPAVKSWRGEGREVYNNKEEMLKARPNTEAYGIITGKESNLIVIDIDNKKGKNGNEAFKQLLLDVFKDECNYKKYSIG